MPKNDREGQRDLKMLQDLYSSCMNESRIRDAGISPLLIQIQELLRLFQCLIATFSNVDLAQACASEHVESGYISNIRTKPVGKEQHRTLLELREGGLGMPPWDYSNVKKARLLVQKGDQADVSGRHGGSSRLSRLCHVPHRQVAKYRNDFKRELEPLLQATEARTLQTYFVWRIIGTYAEFVSPEHRWPMDEFKTAVLAQERWRYNVDIINSNLGHIAGHFFVQKMFQGREPVQSQNSGQLCARHRQVIAIVQTSGLAGLISRRLGIREAYKNDVYLTNTTKDEFKAGRAASKISTATSLSKVPAARYTVSMACAL
ncbi:hypothetical protein BGZ75_001026 [Mortierella antarctica]|nr:hypothetical protein BGZ75_001026 [Mortierella antarctica]